MFQVEGIDPMMGQFTVFHRHAPEKIPCAIEPYQREVRRLLEVLDGRRLAASGAWRSQPYFMKSRARNRPVANSWQGAVSTLASVAGIISTGS